MQKSLIVLLFTSLLLFWGCGKQSSGPDTTGPDLPLQNDPANPSTEETATLPDSITEAMVMKFVPAGYDLLDWKAGDLNRDAYDDVVMVLDSSLAPEDQDYEARFDESLRPVILLSGSANGLEKSAQNDHVALCSACGGVFGDPFEGITIKNGYFSIEHYGGSNWRWTRIITFKYDDNKKDWFLHRDGGESFHTSEPEKVEEKVRTTKDFGVVKFVDFHSDNT